MIFQKIFKQLNIFIYLITLAIFFIILAKIFDFSVNIVSSSVAVNAFNEVRDYASFRLTHLIMQGKNPYSVNILYDNTVPFLYLYTPLMPMFVAAICKLTGLSIILGYYYVNFLFIILTVLNIILILKNRIIKNKLVFLTYILLIAFAVSTLFSLFGMILFNFRTGPIAIYIMSLIFLLIDKNYKLTTLVSILSVLLVFTMQVMFIEVLSILVFYFIIDKKVLIVYCIKMIVIGMLTILAVYYFCPLYWFESIYAMLFTNLNYGGILSSFSNIVKFFNRYLTLMFLMVLGGGYICFKDKNTFLFKQLIEYFSQQSVFILIFINLIISIIASIYFAKGGQDGFKYCQALIGINVLMLSMFLFAAFVNTNFSQLFHLIAFAICSICIIGNFSFNYYKTDNLNEYNRMTKDLSKYNIEDIYFGVNCSHYLMNLDAWESKNVYFNDGHIQYFNRRFPRIPYISDLFNISEIENFTSDYTKEINERIRDQSFELITLCIDDLVDKQLLLNYYEKDDEYFIKSDTNGFTVVSYVPKRN